MHLRFDLLLQRYFAPLQDLLNVRAQLPRFGIHNRELLLDAECEDMGVAAHA